MSFLGCRFLFWQLKEQLEKQVHQVKGLITACLGLKLCWAYFKQGLQYLQIA